PVLRAERRQHPPRPRLRVDGRLEIGGDGHVPAAAVGAIPAAVGLRGLHCLEAVLGHPAFGDQPGDVVDIDSAPDAALAAARVALQVTLVVAALAHRVDPAPAEAHVDRLPGRDRLQARAHFVNPDPDLVCLVVVQAEPPLERGGGLEGPDLGGIDVDGRHHDTYLAPFTPECRSELPVRPVASEQAAHGERPDVDGLIGRMTWAGGVCGGIAHATVNFVSHALPLTEREACCRQYVTIMPAPATLLEKRRLKALSIAFRRRRLTHGRVLRVVSASTAL